MSNPIRLGERIADPRVLSDELGVADPTDAPHPDMYSGLANYTFGNPRPPSRPSSLSSYDALSEPVEPISPLTPVVRRPSPDRTPRSSVFDHPASPPFRNVSSHPSQGLGRPASSHQHSSSHSRRRLATRDHLPAITSGPKPRAVSGSDSERSQDPTSSTDPIIPAFHSSYQRGRVMPDNASQHTFGPASRTHRATMESSQDGAHPSSSSISVTTSRSSSRASMCTTEQFSSDDEFEFDYYDGSSSPVTFARDLVDIDEDADLDQPGPSTFRTSLLDGRRGSLPMAIPGAVQGSDAFSTRSREGSILTVRRPSRSWDDTNTHLSSHSGEDPSVILPKSEPNSRADWISVEAQLQAKQQQQQLPVADVYDGIDIGYIIPKRSEGSIHSFNSRLSFVHTAAYPRKSSPYSPAIPLGLGSSSALPFEDSFLSHLQKHDQAFPALRYLWSFQREKADASSSSSRRRQQVNHHRTDKPVKEIPLRIQEMWRCGNVGRFKIDRLSVKRACIVLDSNKLIIPRSLCYLNVRVQAAQSADPAKGAQQRIHVRHIPDPFLAGNTITGPHSVIHKHSRAVAFSIFRSHGLFSVRQAGGAGPSSGRTHINMRLGIMLAPKKVQEQYTSTKTTRQLSTYGLLDSDSRGARDKDKDRAGRRDVQSIQLRQRDSGDRERRRTQERADKGKGKTKASNKSRDKSDKKHRLNPTESTESSTATSSAGSITNSALQQVVSAPEQLAMKIHLPPSVSSSTSIYGRESVSRPASPTSLLPPSISDSVKIPESESSSVLPARHHRDHRDSIDSDDRLPPRTTHAEAFSALDPNDIENLRLKANNRANTDSGSTFERLFRRFRSSARTDDHASFSNQPRAFQPPWLTTAGRDQQEENDRVLNDLNASFRDVGLLHTNPHKPLRTISKRRSNQGILDQIPDDSLYMLLPLWPGETDTASIHAETSSAASFVTIPENQQYLLVYYIPFGEVKSKDKKPEKKKAKQSHSSDSGVEDAKNIYLSAFRVVARVVTYDELRLTGIRVPSDGLAINGPEWEAISYPASAPLRDAQMTDAVVCQCYGRELGFDFVEEGLLKLGLCTREEYPIQALSNPEEEEREGKTVLTTIGRAAVEMIWLGCLAITSFGST